MSMTPDVAAPAVRCEQLTKRYGKSRGVEELSLTVEAGEVFGFLGPNGAGKTTTIRTLLDLHRPTSGSASIFGLDCQADSLEIRARTGNLAGDFAISPELTGQRAVSIAAAIRGVNERARVGELAERFNADLSRPMHELSRGNRQKIGLILALFHRPELLILDEPTSGLDPLMQSEFLALIGEEKARGTTIFLSSHELSEVQAVCDRVAMIRDGRLIATEDVGRMRDRALRHVTARFRDGAAPVDFGGIPGVTDVQNTPGGLRCQVHGDVSPLVAALTQAQVVDLEISRPSLDELFLQYYREPVHA